MNWPSVTYRYRVPCENGCKERTRSAFVQIVSTSEPLIFISTGKAGSEVNGLADALARVTARALRYGVPPLELAVMDLRGMSQADYNPLAHDASSIPDALGKALEAEYAEVTRCCE